MSDAESTDEQPLTYALRFTERAQRDLDAATVHFAESASPQIAVAWRDGPYEALAPLSTFPRRFPSAPERFRREVRQMLYRHTGSQVAYRILFSVAGEDAASQDAPTVVILHVRHASSRRMTRTQARSVEQKNE